MKSLNRRVRREMLAEAAERDVSAFSADFLSDLGGKAFDLSAQNPQPSAH